MDNKELKRCPFCGGFAKFEVIASKSNHQGAGFKFEIRCKDCQVALPKTYGVYFNLTVDGELRPFEDERQKARDEWNGRADNG